MGLSFFAKKYANIKTFVPPHPTRHQEQWGAIPELSRKLGTSNCAVSLNADNANKMNKAINEYLCEEYKPIVEENKLYVDKMYKSLFFAKFFTRYVPLKKFRHFLRGKLFEFFYN